MKYAIIGPRKVIRKIVDDKPSADITFIELTNKKAATAASFLKDKQFPLVFKDEITTFKTEYENGKPLRWDSTANQYVQVVPLSVPAWKVKAVAKLTPCGEVTLYDAIAATLNELAEPSKTIASAAWYEGNTVERNSITVISCANLLGLTKETIDELFIQANALKV